MEFFFSTNDKNFSTFANGVSNINQFNANLTNIIQHNQDLKEQLKFTTSNNFQNIALNNQFNHPQNPPQNHLHRLENSFNHTSTTTTPQSDTSLPLQQPFYAPPLPNYYFTDFNQVHPILTEINDYLDKQNNNLTEQENQQEKNIPENSAFKEIINKIESVDDDRMKNSSFLSFIKDLDKGKLKIDEANNTIKEINLNEITEKNLNSMSSLWNKISSEIDSLPLEALSLSKEEFYPEALKYYELHDTKTALSLLKSEVVNNPQNASAMTLLAKLYMECNRDDLAIEYSEKALKIDPENLDSFLILAMCYSNEGNEYKCILNVLNWLQYNKNYSPHYESEKQNSIFISKEFVEKFLNTDNFAIEDKSSFQSYEKNRERIFNGLDLLFDKLRKNKSDCDVLLLQGIVNLNKENFQKAREIFEQITVEKPKDHSAWSRLGAIYANSDENGKAFELYKKALTINPNYPRCLSNIGVGHLMMGDQFNASRNFIKSLKIYNDAPEIWNYLTGIFLSLEREDLVNKCNQRDINGIQL